MCFNFSSKCWLVVPSFRQSPLASAGMGFHGFLRTGPLGEWYAVLRRSYCLSVDTWIPPSSSCLVISKVEEARGNAASKNLCGVTHPRCQNIAVPSQYRSSSTNCGQTKTWTKRCGSCRAPVWCANAVLVNLVTQTSFAPSSAKGSLTRTTETREDSPGTELHGEAQRST